MRSARLLSALSLLLFSLSTIAADKSPVQRPDEPSGFHRWPQLAALSTSNQYPYFFGASVAIDGDTIVVGAPNGGYASVFVKPASGWRNMTEVATLSLPGEACDFGTSVAVGGDTIVVGQPQIQFCSTSLGNAYVFVKPPGGWSGTVMPVATLTASDGIENDGFGSSVSIDGDTIVAGAPDFHVSLAGAAYVFVEPAGGWSNMTQTAKLTASDGKPEDELGTAVSINGTTVVAGAPDTAGSRNSEQGAAYVFVEPASGWSSMTQTGKLTASDNTVRFGTSVALDGSTVVVGSPNTYQPHTPGAAYVFVEPKSGWMNMNQTARLIRGGSAYSDSLGASVAIRGDRVAVGAPSFSPASNFGGEGAAFVFDKPPRGWTNATPNGRCNGSDARARSLLGTSVAIDGHLVVAGTEFNSILQRTNGGVYIFIGP